MRVVVTRPEPQAAEWTARLRAAGLDAIALPLLAIAEAPDAAAVAKAREALAEFDWIVFVSPAAVRRFFDVEGVGFRWPEGAGRAAAPGDGTAEALRAAGVPAARIVSPDPAAGRFDAEALWEVVRTELGTGTGTDTRRRGERVLIVRGTEGSDWLAERFRAAAADVETLAVYRREDAVLDASQRRQLEGALAEPAGHAWLVASASAVDALVRSISSGPAGSADAAARLAPATAIATHPRIAGRAAAAGFGRVLLADGGFASVVRCIESADP